MFNFKEHKQTQDPHIEKTSNVYDSQHVDLKKGKQKRIRKVILGLLAAVIFLLCTTIYLQYEVYGLKKIEATRDEVPSTPNQIIDAVKRHIIVPGGEPQIAAVEDAKKLNTSQAFFKDALNGDVVLVYETMIILYRPSLDIVVAVGVINTTNGR